MPVVSLNVPYYGLAFRLPPQLETGTTCVHSGGRVHAWRRPELWAGSAYFLSDDVKSQAMARCRNKGGGEVHRADRYAIL